MKGAPFLGVVMFSEKEVCTPQHRTRRRRYPLNATKGPASIHPAAGAPSWREHCSANRAGRDLKRISTIRAPPRARFPSELATPLCPGGALPSLLWPPTGMPAWKNPRRRPPREPREMIFRPWKSEVRAERQRTALGQFSREGGCDADTAFPSSGRLVPLLLTHHWAAPSGPFRHHGDASEAGPIAKIPLRRRIDAGVRQSDHKEKRKRKGCNDDRLLWQLAPCAAAARTAGSTGWQDAPIEVREAGRSVVSALCQRLLRSAFGESSDRQTEPVRRTCSPNDCHRRAEATISDSTGGCVLGQSACRCHGAVFRSRGKKLLFPPDVRSAKTPQIHVPAINSPISAGAVSIQYLI